MDFGTILLIILALISIGLAAFPRFGNPDYDRDHERRVMRAERRARRIRKKGRR